MRTWVWVGHLWTSRVRLALEHYGDRITDVSIFGWSVAADGSLSLTFDPEALLPYRERWPHLRFWLAFRNDGYQSIVHAILQSGQAQARLLADLDAALDRYPWLGGIDIDLERIGGSEWAAPTEALFRRIAAVAHRRGLECSAALPPLTATGSVGGENWARYNELAGILDHLAIMSYDFAWSGSAPGPVSPGFWMEDVYDWAVSQVPREKLLMGLPLYSYFWTIHNYPAALGETYRGSSGSYYAAWQHFTGYRAQDGTDANPAGSGKHHKIGWLAFRDADSASAHGLMNVYDWRYAADWDTDWRSGIIRSTYDGRPYTTRYGRPSGSPMWSVADNSGFDKGAAYTLNPRRVRNTDGELVAPKVGFTLTVELLKRYPVAATIMDDNAGTAGQLAAYYRTDSGSWAQWSDGEGYGQYRGSGQLRLNKDFTGQALLLQVRGQHAGSGWSGVTVRGLTAEAHPSGRVRLRQGSTVLQEVAVASRPVGGAPGTGRFHLALRVREGSARVYYALSDTSDLPLVIHAAVAPTGGVAAIVSEAGVWLDRVYVGDGWWYQPREAVQVDVGFETKVLGRFPRTGVTWDSRNRFRPTADVDEWETRTASPGLDWVYEHWVDVPMQADVDARVQVRAIDHDVWVGRLFAVDRDGASIAYWSDADTIAHWRDRAAYDYGVSGIALWTLGQEDIRLWDRLAEGRLPAETKILNA